MKRKLLALLCVLAVFLGACSHPRESAAQMQVYFFSAGDADAMLLTTEHSAVLIDAGERTLGDEILAYCGEQGIEKLDYLILTHFDKDHIGGAAKILRKMPVGQVLQSNYPRESQDYDRYLAALQKAKIEPITVREELSFSLDGLLFTVDPPKQEQYRREPSNNSSLIVSVVCGECSLLFLGDAENERLEEWSGSHPEHYDAVKLPHHGNWHKSITGLLKAAAPAYALISSSAVPPEDDKTVSLLKRLGIEPYYTANGPVLLVCDGESLSLRYAAGQ